MAKRTYSHAGLLLGPGGQKVAVKGEGNGRTPGSSGAEVGLLFDREKKSCIESFREGE